jgi:hypothetical protein
MSGIDMRRCRRGGVLVELNLKTGVRTFGLMKTLMSVFPLVKQVWSIREISDAQLAQPYSGWHLLAFDSYLNIMVSRYMEELIRLPAKDMVILVGPVAREWVTMRRC